MAQKEMTSRGKRAPSLKMDNIQHFDEKNAEEGKDFEQQSHFHLEVSPKGAPKINDHLGLGAGSGLGLGLGAGAPGSGWTPVCVYIVREIYAD